MSISSQSSYVCANTERTASARYGRAFKNEMPIVTDTRSLMSVAVCQVAVRYSSSHRSQIRAQSYLAALISAFAEQPA